jgi:hypothetical protein
VEKMKRIRSLKHLTKFHSNYDSEVELIADIILKMNQIVMWCNNVGEVIDDKERDL